MTTEHPPLDAAIRERLHAALQPQHLTLLDESHLHAGHAGAREGRHYRVRIAAPAFEGLSRVAQHRLVYDALSDFMKKGIHALAIEVIAPSA